MTYADHTANYRRFQGALVCEQCHALHENCPHHRHGIRASLRAFWQRWQLSEAEGRLDEEIARRKAAEREVIRARVTAHQSLLAIDGRKGRA